MGTQIDQPLRTFADAGSVAPHVAARLMDFTRHDPVLLRLIAKELSGPQLSGMAMLPDPLPAPAQMVEDVDERIDALPRAGRQLIAVASASVLDRADVLLAAAAVDVGVVSNEEVSRVLIFEEGRFRFRDHRVRMILGQRLLPQEREAAHRSLARATGERDLTLIASWHAAQLHPSPTRSSGALLALAETLLRCGDVHGAWSVATATAMAMRDDLEAAGRAQLIAGRAAFANGCFDDAEMMLDQAARVGSPAQRSAAAAARDAATAVREGPGSGVDPLLRLSRHLDSIAAAAVTATDAKAMDDARKAVRERADDPAEADAIQARLHIGVMKSRPPWPWHLDRGPLSPLIEAFVRSQQMELQLRSGDLNGAALTLRDAARRLPMTHVGTGGTERAVDRLAPNTRDIAASLTDALIGATPERTISFDSFGPRPGATSAAITRLHDHATSALTPHLPVGVGTPALSERQRQIACLVLEGQNNREIAEALGISPRTVEVHVSDVLRKAGVRNRVELVARLFRAGWQSGMSGLGETTTSIERR